MAETACPVYFICDQKKSCSVSEFCGNQCKLTTLQSHSVNGKAYVEEFDDIGRPYLREVQING